MIRSVLTFALVFFFLLPQPAYAHAFGEMYRMPIPLSLYLFGGAGALILSFFLIGYFTSRGEGKIRLSQKDITQNPIIRFFRNRIVVSILKLLSVFLLVLCILSGFFGTQIVTYNFNMTFFWIIFVVGFPYLVGLFGNIWETLSPWKSMLAWVEKITDLDIDGFVTYPSSFGYYPALLGFFVFILLEIVFDKSPFSLASFLLLYTNYAFLMAIVFGKKAWEKYIDFFSVFFRLISEVAPLTKEGGKIYLRAPFAGAIGKKAEHMSLVFFILFMLASTAVDGFMGTSLWLYIFYDVLRPLVLAIGINAYQIIQSLLIFLSPFLFFAVFALALLFVRILTKTQHSLTDLAFRFAYSLIPIAFVYHFAHYFVFLVVQGQEIIPLLSDPFGQGLNLFGTANFIANPSLLSVNVVWHLQVGAILLGHIAGVFISHADSQSLFPHKRQAFVSQIPLLMLMVFYTVVGLWILAQPITAQ